MVHRKVFVSELLRGMLFLGIVGFFFQTMPVWAEDDLFTSAYNTLLETFRETRRVVYVLSGFGLVGFSCAAIFGKISFKWLAMIAVALFTLAMAEKIIEAATDPDSIEVTSSFSVHTNEFDLDLSGAGSFNTNF